MNEGLNIFGKTTAPAITDARKQETFADPVVAADTPSHHIHVGAHEFAQPRHLVRS